MIVSPSAFVRMLTTREPADAFCDESLAVEFGARLIVVCRCASRETVELVPLRESECVVDVVALGAAATADLPEDVIAASDAGPSIAVDLREAAGMDTGILLPVTVIVVGAAVDETGRLVAVDLTGRLVPFVLRGACELIAVVIPRVGALAPPMPPDPPPCASALPMPRAATSADAHTVR